MCHPWGGRGPHWQVSPATQETSLSSETFLSNAEEAIRSHPSYIGCYCRGVVVVLD